MNDEFVFHNNNSKLLDNFLNNDYPEISKAIKKEGYNLDFLEYDFFHEIHFENHIVGFITLKKFSLVDNQFSIMDAYIIPEYRDISAFFATGELSAAGSPSFLREKRRLVG